MKRNEMHTMTSGTCYVPVPIHWSSRSGSNGRLRTASSHNKLTPAALTRPGVRSHDWSRAMPHSKRPYRQLVNHARNQDNIVTHGDEWIERLGQRVKIINGCWLVDGNASSYATVMVGGRQTPAHRATYEIKHGLIDPAMHVHHSCLNPGCINPAHLAALTPADHAAVHAELRRSAS